MYILLRFYTKQKMVENVQMAERMSFYGIYIMNEEEQNIAVLESLAINKVLFFSIL